MANLSNNSRKPVDESNVAVPTYAYEPVIANGGTESDGIFLAGFNVIGLLFPAAMTGTNLTVEISFDGSTWKTLNGVSITVAADEAVELATTTIYGWPFVRFVSDAAEGAERTLTVLVKQL